MSAERQIEALLHEYARRIDDGDFDGIGDLFADGAVRDGSGAVVARGADQVRALYERTTRRFPDGTPLTQHVTSGITVSVDRDGTGASATSSFTVLQALDGRIAPIVAGRYEDRFASADGAWRFTDRVMHVRLVGDVSNHLLVDLDRGAGRT